MPTSQTRIYEATPDSSTKVTIVSTATSGETQTRGAIFKEDGKLHAVSGSQNYDMAATTRISRLRSKDTLMRSGTTVGTLVRSESKNLAVLTITFSFSTPSGQLEHDVLVYDRQ